MRERGFRLLPNGIHVRTAPLHTDREGFQYLAKHTKSDRRLCLCVCGAVIWRTYGSLSGRDATSHCSCLSNYKSSGWGVLYAMTQMSPVDRHIRVGFTKNIERRRNEHLAASPYPMMDLLGMEGTRGHERTIHDLLSPFVVSHTASWYRATDEVLEFFHWVRTLGIRDFIRGMYQEYWSYHGSDESAHSSEEATKQTRRAYL